MPLIQPQVLGPCDFSTPDDDVGPALAGKAGEPITAGLHGKYFTQCARGNIFLGTTGSSAFSVPVFSSTGPRPGLWNPTGSGKNLVLIKLQMGTVSISNNTSHFCLGYQGINNAQLATAGGMTVFTTVPIINLCLGAPNTSVANFAPVTITASAPSYLRPVGITKLTGIAPVARNNYWQLTEYYDGELIINPGSVIFVCNAATAGTDTWSVAMTWEEVPV